MMNPFQYKNTEKVFETQEYYKTKIYKHKNKN